MKILVIGSGPDRIGKTGELDRLALGGLDLLARQGHQAVYVDDNPWALAGVPAAGRRVYLEPLGMEVLERVLERERPQALLHDFGGPLAQHLTVFLEREGVLDRLEVEILGTPNTALRRLLDSDILTRTLAHRNIPAPPSATARSLQQCLELASSLGFPCRVRPAFPLEGLGGYLMFNREEVPDHYRLALQASPVREVILDRLPLGGRLWGLMCLHHPGNPGKVAPAGTWEAVDVPCGVHAGNAVLLSPARVEQDTLQEALAWAGALAGDLGIAGCLHLELALDPRGAAQSLLSVRQGLGRLASFLALAQGLPLGEITVGLALGLPWQEVMSSRPPGGNLHAARVRVLEPEWAQPGPVNPTMFASGAAFRMGQDRESCLARCLELLNPAAGKPPSQPAQGASAWEQLSDRRSFLAMVPAPSEETLEEPAALHPGPKVDIGPALWFMARQKGASLAAQKDPQSVVLLGPGPVRTGWGAERGAALWRTARALTEAGKQVVIIDDNPDGPQLAAGAARHFCLESAHSLRAITSCLEHFGAVGLIHQFCLTPPAGLEKLCDRLGVQILGTPPASLEALNRRDILWRELKDMGIPLISHGFVPQPKEAAAMARGLGYPVLIRLSDSLINPEGAICYQETDLERFLLAHGQRVGPRAPLLVERYPSPMVGAQLLALADGEQVMSLGLVENVEDHGIHSGDCAATGTPLSIGRMPWAMALDSLGRIAARFAIRGHLTLELAVAGRHCFVTGVLPFPGRNLALVERAGGVDPHRLAAGVLLGERIQEECNPDAALNGLHLVKEAHFCFRRFPGLAPSLSPSMRSTGQVLGRDHSVGRAFLKSQLAVNPELPLEGKVFISTRDEDKDSTAQICQKLLALGYGLISTQGTALFLTERGLPVKKVAKVSQGRPHILDLIKNGQVCMVINIPGGLASQKDDERICRSAVEHGIPLFTTISGTFLMVSGLEEIRQRPLDLTDPEEPREE